MTQNRWLAWARGRTVRPGARHRPRGVGMTFLRVPGRVLFVRGSRWSSPPSRPYPVIRHTARIVIVPVGRPPASPARPASPVGPRRSEALGRRMVLPGVPALRAAGTTGTAGIVSAVRTAAGTELVARLVHARRRVEQLPVRGVRPGVPDRTTRPGTPPAALMVAAAPAVVRQAARGGSHPARVTGPDSRATEVRDPRPTALATAAEPSWPGGTGTGTGTSPDLERLTDQIVDRLDARLTAQRERFGRGF
ncbi:hypothetical protein [Nonomuraea sp. NPDC002799]